MNLRGCHYCRSFSGPRVDHNRKNLTRDTDAPLAAVDADGWFLSHLRRKHNDLGAGPFQKLLIHTDDILYCFKLHFRVRNILGKIEVVMIYTEYICAIENKRKCGFNVKSSESINSYSV